MDARHGSKKELHVVWDEQNLAANEEIKREYAAIKIAEPKTPYRPPLPAAESLEEEMKPLQLDEHALVAAAAQQARAGAGAAGDGMTAFDFVMSNGGADYVPPGAARPQSATSNASQDAQAQEAQAQQLGGGSAGSLDAVGDKRTQPCNSFTSSGSEGPCSSEKRRRFEALRKQHYNMRTALQQAKQLLASEDEEEPGGHEADEGDEDDTAGWHRSNGSTPGDAQHSTGMDASPAERHEQQQERQPAPRPAQVQQQRRRQHGGGEPLPAQQPDGMQDMDSSGEQAAGPLASSS